MYFLWDSALAAFESSFTAIQFRIEVSLSQNNVTVNINVQNIEWTTMRVNVLISGRQDIILGTFQQSNIILTKIFYSKAQFRLYKFLWVNKWLKGQIPEQNIYFLSQVFGHPKQLRYHYLPLWWMGQTQRLLYLWPQGLEHSYKKLDLHFLSII